jgi:lipoprotein
VLFKALQVCSGDIDVGYTLILTYQFLYGLFACRRKVPFGFGLRLSFLKLPNPPQSQAKRDAG